MVPKLQELDKFSLTKKNIAYIRDEVSKLQPCANALTCIISHSNLALLEPFSGLCLGHAFQRYANNMLLQIKKCLLVCFVHL
jgi:hypothetical protein